MLIVGLRIMRVVVAEQLCIADTVITRVAVSAVLLPCVLGTVLVDKRVQLPPEISVLSL
jgi:hypothetical protein